MYRPKNPQGKRAFCGVGLGAPYWKRRYVNLRLQYIGDGHKYMIVAHVVSMVGPIFHGPPRPRINIFNRFSYHVVSIEGYP
jgi:hypothetical protein